MSFECRIENEGQGLRIRLLGILDEQAELPPIPRGVKGQVVVDLSELRMINSIGCRNWIQWLRARPSGTALEIDRCPTVIVNQINTLATFVPPGVKIRSIYVPYFCLKCQANDLDLVELVEPRIDFSHVADERTCPHCSTSMELDVVKEHYFSFLMRKAA